MVRLTCIRQAPHNRMPASSRPRGTKCDLSRAPVARFKLRGSRRQFCQRLQARVCATVQPTVILTRRHEHIIASALSAAAARETKLARALAVRLDSHSTRRKLCHRSWTQLCATVRAHPDSQNGSQCRAPPAAPTETCFAACAFAARLNCEAPPSVALSLAYGPVCNSAPFNIEAHSDRQKWI